MANIHLHPLVWRCTSPDRSCGCTIDGPWLPPRAGCPLQPAHIPRASPSSPIAPRSPRRREAHGSSSIVRRQSMRRTLLNLAVAVGLGGPAPARAEHTICTAAGAQDQIAVASGDSSAVVLWRDNRYDAGGNPYDI